LEGVLWPEELERDKRAVWVVLIAYGWGFGLRAGSLFVDEPRERGEVRARVVDVLMEPVQVFTTKMINDRIVDTEDKAASESL
jgi:hypothetical protein